MRNIFLLFFTLIANIANGQWLTPIADTTKYLNKNIRLEYDDMTDVVTYFDTEYTAYLSSIKSNSVQSAYFMYYLQRTSKGITLMPIITYSNKEALYVQTILFKIDEDLYELEKDKDFFYSRKLNKDYTYSEILILLSSEKAKSVLQALAYSDNIKIRLTGVWHKFDYEFPNNTYRHIRIMNKYRTQMK